jgi:hypothetical protein
VTLPDIPALYAEHGTHEKVAEILGWTTNALVLYIDTRSDDLWDRVDRARAEWARRADTR